MRGRKFLIGYFVTFTVLSALAQVPVVVFIALVVSAGVLGFLLMASPTVLLYSAALLPAWHVAGTAGRRPWHVAVALLIPLLIAVVPGAMSLAELRWRAAEVASGDFARPAPARPRSIELAGDEFSELFHRGAGDSRAPCGYSCLRLLFNREVERVRVTKWTLPDRNAPPRTLASVDYRVEQRPSCPDINADSMYPDKALRDRIVAGDCLIASPAGADPVDASLSLLTLHHWQSLPQTGLDGTADIKSIRRLSVRQGETPVMQRTEIAAHPLALPFYFGYEIHFQGGPNGQRLGRMARTINPADPPDVLRAIYGFKVEPIEPPSPEDAARVAERILSLPAWVQTFSAQQQDVLHDMLKPLTERPALSDADLDLLRRVIGDRRIDLGQIAITLQTLFRKNAERMAPLIPVAIERLAVPVPERIGHYQNTLGWALMVYPAAVLQPRRDAIMAIVEAQPDWPSAGLLARLGELDGDASDLVERRLGAKSHISRQAAATAICRATPTNWTRLEPIALARLRAAKPPARPLDDEDRKLLLALIRFGKKDLADTLLASINPSNKEWNERWLATAAQDFTIDKCR